jgi:hypothetical protein
VGFEAVGSVAMKVIYEQTHYIPLWISHPSQFLNPNFSHLLNLPQKYLFSALFYGIWWAIRRINCLTRIPSSFLFIYFIMIILQSSVINDSSIREYDMTNQHNSLLGNGIFILAFKYEMGIRVANYFYPNVVPSYYSGSIDGDFMWATLLHSYPIRVLYPWIWFKYLKVLVDSFSVCISLVANASISRIFRKIGLIVHWTCKLNLYYHILSGQSIPYLLWVPDTIVLAAACLFDLGLMFGVKSDQVVKSKKKRKSSRIYHTKSALSNSASAVKELAKKIL